VLVVVLRADDIAPDIARSFFGRFDALGAPGKKRRDSPRRRQSRHCDLADTTSKACEIISAPTLAVGELTVVGESSLFEPGQLLRDRLAIRARQSLPEGFAERAAAYINLRNIRNVLARCDFSTDALQTPLPVFAGSGKRRSVSCRSW
jgi:hypothetical protein